MAFKIKSLLKAYILQTVIDSFSQNYYFLFLSLLLRSDMDECHNSPSVCDVNANCSNTHGSYVCSCIAGFSGDGKACNSKINMLNKLLSRVVLLLGWVGAALIALVC